MNFKKAFFILVIIFSNGVLANPQPGQTGLDCPNNECFAVGPVTCGNNNQHNPARVIFFDTVTRVPNSSSKVKLIKSLAGILPMGIIATHGESRKAGYLCYKNGNQSLDNGYMNIQKGFFSSTETDEATVAPTVAKFLFGDFADAIYNNKDNEKQYDLAVVLNYNRGIEDNEVKYQLRSVDSSQLTIPGQALTPKGVPSAFTAPDIKAYKFLPEAVCKTSDPYCENKIASLNMPTPPSDSIANVTLGDITYKINQWAYSSSAPGYRIIPFSKVLLSGKGRSMEAPDFDRFYFEMSGQDKNGKTVKDYLIATSSHDSIAWQMFPENSGQPRGCHYLVKRPDETNYELVFSDGEASEKATGQNGYNPTGCTIIKGKTTFAQPELILKNYTPYEFFVLADDTQTLTANAQRHGIFRSGEVLGNIYPKKAFWMYRVFENKNFLTPELITDLKANTHNAFIKTSAIDWDRWFDASNDCKDKFILKMPVPSAPGPIMPDYFDSKCGIFISGLPYPQDRIENKTNFVFSVAENNQELTWSNKVIQQKPESKTWVLQYQDKHNNDTKVPAVTITTSNNGEWNHGSCLTTITATEDDDKYTVSLKASSPVGNTLCSVTPASLTIPKPKPEPQIVPGGQPNGKTLGENPVNNITCADILGLLKQGKKEGTINGQVVTLTLSPNIGNLKRLETVVSSNAGNKECTLSCYNTTFFRGCPSNRQVTVTWKINDQ